MQTKNKDIITNSIGWLTAIASGVPIIGMIMQYVTYKSMMVGAHHYKGPGSPFLSALLVIAFSLVTMSGLGLVFRQRIGYLMWLTFVPIVAGVADIFLIGAVGFSVIDGGLTMGELCRWGSIIAALPLIVIPAILFLSRPEIKATFR